MSQVSDAAIVRIMIADFVNVVANKINMIGGSVGVLGVSGGPTATQPKLEAAHAVFASVAVPPELQGAQANIEFSLEDSAGNVVSLAGPDEPQPQEIKFAQSVAFIEPILDNAFNVPSGLMRARIQMVMNFPTGLPLELDRLYQWRIAIDGVTRPEWTEQIYVAHVK